MDPPIRKRRPAVACTECRRRKVKCDRNLPCGPCVQTSLLCAYRPPSQPTQLGVSYTGSNSHIAAPVSLSPDIPSWASLIGTGSLPCPTSVFGTSTTDDGSDSSVLQMSSSLSYVSRLGSFSPRQLGMQAVYDQVRSGISIIDITIF